MGKAMAVKTPLTNINEVKFEVDARYTVLETIGNGAYGVVCSAFDNKLNSKVAIKKISRIFDIPTIAKRTLRELKILKYLNHHNVISIKDILRPPEDFNKFQDVYVVLDLMESDLHHIIYSKQTLSEDHVRYFLYQILCGLKYIHSAKFLHRDLKPSNLLVNGNCDLKIGDFGMARSLDSSPTEQKRVMTEYVQTRWYRAPELMLSVHQFNTGIDMWSVGCIFAEMLARRPLFPGANYLNQLQLILSVVGLPSEDFLSHATSERVKTYISKLPHKDPVALATLFPNASTDAINLLEGFLKLDPNQRCSAERALASPFLRMYHNLDDEPTCAPLKFNFDAVPLEKNALRAAILNEILHLHINKKGANLTPVTKSLTSVVGGYNANQALGTVSSQGNPSIISAQLFSSCDNDKESRKRKNAKGKKDCKTKRNKEESQDTQEGNKNLSEQDRQMLERWTKMQRTTKPFVHPIRKHMDELMQLRAQSVTLPEVTTGKDITGNHGTDSMNGKPQVQFQFTNFVPVVKGDGVTLVKDTVKPENQTKGKVMASLSTGQKAVLVPVGSIPCYRLEGPLKQKGSLVIVQPALSKQSLQVQQAKTALSVSGGKDKETKIVPVAAVPPITSTSTKECKPISQPKITSIKNQDSTSLKKDLGQSSGVNIVGSSSNLVLVPLTKTSNSIASIQNDNIATFSNASKKTCSVASKPIDVPRMITVSKAECAPAISVNDIQHDGKEITKDTSRTSYEVLSCIPKTCLEKTTENFGSEGISSVSSCDSVALSGINYSSFLHSADKNLRESVVDVSSTLISETNVSTSLKLVSSELPNNSDETTKKAVQGLIPPPTKAPTKQFTPREKAILQIIEQIQSTKATLPGENISEKEEQQLATADNELITPAIDGNKCGNESYSTSVSDVSEITSAGNKNLNDILLTTLLTPKTPKSGACGYGLGFDLEEMLSQTGLSEFWNSASRPTDAETSSCTDLAFPPLSASLLNDWLDVRSMEPSDMEELQHELESSSSLLLFDS